jgi:hypothetical protein
VPVAHGFYWSENLHDLIGPFASVSNIRAVAWDETYVFAKSDDEYGSWYIIDTRGTGVAAVESYAPASAAWSQRLDELGRAAPGWRDVAALPRPWFSNPGCQLKLVVLLTAVLAVVYWPYSILILAASGTAILAFRRTRRRPR